ncbi:fatty-acid amide hydrolase 2-A isoform X2 [Parasteatoda tepidariorum]|uniref:fatty-acid amide hydrolase 2-A isoform X2 n=1 Tax=Parasteatoda tepidariorum TaxID=114398 RepID=UPI0039BD8C2B
MTNFKYYLKRCFFLFCCVLLETILAVVYYWVKKKTIPPIRNSLLLKSATTLAEEIREGKLKGEDVIQAYVDRILEVNPIINAVVQDNFEEALREAKEVDTFIESGEFSLKELKEEKPLLGVPFTVKCSFSVKGFYHTAGSLLFKDVIGTEDAPCVALLKKAGGIFLATTNCPEFACSIETANYLHGRTCNPYDTTKTCGGSSGLTSLDGMLPKRMASVDDYLSTGPLCRYSEDLATMLNVLSMSKKNLCLLPQVKLKKLKVYYQTHLKYAWCVNTESEVAQAVRKAALYFKQAYDAEIKEVDVLLFNKSNAITLHLFRKGIDESKFIEHVTDGRVKELHKVSEFIKIILGKSQFTLASFIILSVSYNWIFYSEKDIALHEKILKDLLREFENLLDENAIFLCPTAPTTAFYHYQMYTHYYSAFWTGVFNLVGFPATQCPMGLSQQNLPVGIQIAGCKGNDALTIACANELEKTFRGWIPPQQNRKCQERKTK